MLMFPRWSRAGAALLLILICGLSVAACDNNTPANPTPVVVVPTLPPRSVAVGPALQSGDPLTFKAALAKAQPKAQEWSSGALLEVASLQSTSEIPAAGDWLFTYTSADGAKRALVAVSTVEVQVQNLNGSVTGLVLNELKQHAALIDKMLDSPAVIDKVVALNYSTAGQDRIKIAYYTAGEDISISARPNPVVQVRLSKGDTAAQLSLDAADGTLISKTDEQQ